MTKLVLIHGIAGDKFEDGVSAPVLALQGEETYAILTGLSEGADKAQFIADASAQFQTEDDVPPEFLWPMLFDNGVAIDSPQLEGTTIEVVYEVAA